MIYSESLYSDVSFLILERIEPLFRFISSVSEGSIPSGATTCSL